MADLPDGMDCGCGQHTAQRIAADEQDIVRDDAATSNVTDLRRARQKARAVIRTVLEDILEWMEANGVVSMVQTDAGARRANQAITEIASERLKEELVAWLNERNKTTMGRAARAAFDAMSAVLDGVEDERLTGEPRFDSVDRETLRQIRQVDAGLLYDTELAENLGLNEPLAEELGDDVTRQLRLGVADGESVPELADRVRAVIDDADQDGRAEMGVSGQTMRSKAELIAHDSVQDAYNSAARGRYLRNGFRFGVFDATIDTKTTDLCTRMNEVVIDMRDDPFLVPPLHPYCRSGIRPELGVDEDDVVRREDIADGILNTIMQTKSYRPPANVAGQFSPTSLTRQEGDV